MKRITLAVILAMTIVAALAQAAGAAATKTAHRLFVTNRRLHEQKSILRFCRNHPFKVGRDPEAIAACGRARYLVPRLRSGSHYLLRLERRHARRERRRERRRIVRGGNPGMRVVSAARRYLGVPYVWGGTSPSGFDCSGLVQYVYRHTLGIAIGRTTYSQMGEGERVSSLRPGDVVFTRGGEHEGIYAGGGEVIHAPHTGTVVQYVPLSYFMSAGWAGARRFAS